LVALLATDQVSNAHGVVSFVVRSELDLAQLRLDIRVLFLGAFEIRQNLLSFVEASLHHQPTGTLRQPGHSGVQDDNEDELECQRNPPRNSTAKERESESDPVGQREAGDVHDELDDNELTSPRCLRRLGLPWRRCRCVHTVSDSCDDAAYDHMGYAVCRALEKSTDAHYGRSDENCLLTAEVVAEYECCDSAKKAADVVDCCDGRFHADVVADAQGVQEVVGYDNTAEYTLIVAELGRSCQHISANIGIQSMVPESYPSRTRQ
jgi:hypothetical protein